MDQDQLIEMIKQIARETVEEYINGQGDDAQQQPSPEQPSQPQQKSKQNSRRTDTDQINTDVQYSQYN